MAKFTAGDFITCETEDGISTLLVNRVFTETDKRRSFWYGKEVYSLDDGNGHCDARGLASQIDSEYTLITD